MRVLFRRFLALLAGGHWGSVVDIISPCLRVVDNRFEGGNFGAFQTVGLLMFISQPDGPGSDFL